VASKKRLKARLKAVESSEESAWRLFHEQANKLAAVDQLIIRTELSGPTIGAWAQQVRDFLTQLVELREIKSGGAAEWARPFTRITLPGRPGVTQLVDEGIYDLEDNVGRLR
jgi:hypothetical protein